MKTLYYDFGEYDIDWDEMIEFYEKSAVMDYIKHNNITDPEQKKLIKDFMHYHMSYVGDKEIEEFCENYEDELMDFYRKDAEQALLW